MLNRVTEAEILVGGGDGENVTTTHIYKGGTKATGCKSDKLAENVRYHRLQRGLSQQELAEGICSMQLISSIERGTSNPRVPILEKLADRLKVPLQKIYHPETGDQFPNRVKLDLVEAYLKRGELEPAGALLEELDASGTLIEVERQTWYLMQGEWLNKSGRAREAVELLEAVLVELEREKSADDELLCRMYNQLGTGFYTLMSLAKAYSAYKRAYQVSLRLPSYELTSAKVSYNLGMVCNQLELADEATLYLMQASEYYEKMTDMRRLADSYFHMAIATKEESYVTKALHLYEGLESLKMANMLKQYRAIHIDAKREYTGAVKELEDLSSEFERFGEFEESLFILASAAKICLEHLDTQRAEDYLKRACIQKEKVKQETTFHVALFHQAKAQLELMLENFDDCLQNAVQSSEIFDKMGLHSDSADSLELGVEALRRTGMHEEALKAATQVNSLLRRVGRDRL